MGIVLEKTEKFQGKHVCLFIRCFTLYALNFVNIASTHGSGTGNDGKTDTQETTDTGT